MKGTCKVCVLLFYYVLMPACSAYLDGELSQLTDCSAKLGDKIIDLHPLALKESLTDDFEDTTGVWKYKYNPCLPFNLPEDPDVGHGDKCLSVALCKYGSQLNRSFFYTLGFQNSAKFELYKDKNETGVQIVYKGFRSMKRKTTYVRLICDVERTTPDDAEFTILKDYKGLGDVYAVLRHLSCCPDGFSLVQNNDDDSNSEELDYNNTNSSDSALVTENKQDPKKVDRIKVMIIVGVNVGVIMMAGLVGLMCYNKRTHLEIYSKLPGIRTTPEWPVPYDVESERGLNTSGPIISVGQQGPSVPQSSKSDFRDGAPNVRRKSLCFPVLEHCGIPEECITLGQRLGGGIFGDTYLGEWTGITVAVKRITLTVHEYQTNQQHMSEMQSHVAYLSKQRHRNIVSVLGYCSESKHPYILTEYVNGQVMKDFVKNAGTQLTWPNRIKILSQVADGMAFLHSTHPPILHRDLRCANMFITNNDVVKVCDFGILKIIQPLRAGCELEDCCCQGRYSACPPSISWTAPEVLAHPNSLEENENTNYTDTPQAAGSHDLWGHVTTSADVYSFGITMWELITGDDPYEDMPTAPEVMEHVMSGGRPEFPEHIQLLEPYTQLATKCWVAAPQHRPSFKQVTVRLKEILHQAKMFQKSLNSKGARMRTRSRSVTFSEDDNKSLR